MKVKSTLKPGAGLGEADLDVEVGDDGRRLTGSVELDNGGNRNTGKLRLSGTINGQNLTGYGDLLSLRALLAEDGGTTLGRLSYTLPVGSRGTKVTASYSDLAYELGERYASLNADGIGNVYSLLVQHPIIRSRNLNLFALFGWDMKDFTDKQNSGATEDERRVKSLRLGVLGDFRDDLAGGALNTFSTYVIGGDLDIQTVSVLNIDQAGYKTNGSFSKFNFSYQRLQHITDRTSVLLAASGQVASKNLSSAEQFSLGGPGGVRAHPVGDGAGDDAMLLTLEARHTLPDVRLAGTPLQLNAFADFGHSKVRHSPLPTDMNNTHNLQGYGVGVNISKQDDYLLRLDWAMRSGEKSSDDDRSGRLWAQAVKWF
jgi:hemolysin activation/secretion protein